MKTAATSTSFDRLEIVFATNGQGVTMAHIAIVSLLENLVSRRHTRVNVLVDDISDKECDILANAANDFDFAKINIVHATEAMAPYKEILGQPRIMKRWPMAVWARCFVDVLLPDVQGKLLYVDTDVLFADDAAKLLDMPMDGFVFAANPECTGTSSTSPDGTYSRLGLDSRYAFYFNSGVMIFNMPEYRAIGGSSRVVEIVASLGRRIRAPDQDALNIMAEGRVKKIHPRWNLNDGWLERQLKFRLSATKLYRGRYGHEMLEGLLDPGIIHYRGGQKPWKWNHRPERKRYEMMMRRLNYLKVGEELPESTAKRRLISVGFDMLHALLRLIARIRLALWRHGLGRLQVFLSL